ncbi:MAG: hypothetical protein WDO74_10940 [Pseudomonadota bacterium]
MAHPTPKINCSEPELLTALDLFAQRVATLVVDRLRAGTEPGWVDQHASALGPRRHCAAVRRRIAEGAPGAERAGRRLLLTPEALQEELSRGSKKRPKVDPEADIRDLAGELGLRLVAGGKP